MRENRRKSRPAKLIAWSGFAASIVLCIFDCVTRVQDQLGGAGSFFVIAATLFLSLVPPILVVVFFELATAPD